MSSDDKAESKSPRAKSPRGEQEVKKKKPRAAKEAQKEASKAEKEIKVEKEKDDDEEEQEDLTSWNAGKDAHKIELDANKDCPITSVTVYNDRAEVVRGVSVSLEAGDTHIIISGISPKIDENSVRVTGGTKGAATILEVSSNMTFLKELDNEKKAEQLKSDLEGVYKQIDKQQRSMARIDKEADWLSGWAASLMTPNSSGPKDAAFPAVNSLTKETLGKTANFLDFYQSKLEEIDEKRNKIKKSMEDLEKQALKIQKEIYVLYPSSSVPLPTKSSSQNIMQLHQQIQQQIQQQQHEQFLELDTLMNNSNTSIAPTVPNVAGKKPIREIIIVVHAKAQTKLSLNAAYVVYGAKWIASYDVRVKSGDPRLELTYYGNIFNDTKEDWNDVKISLSTAKPSVGGSPPNLTTKMITFRQLAPVYQQYASKRKSMNWQVQKEYRKVQNMDMQMEMMDDMEDEQAYLDDYSKPRGGEAAVLTTSAKESSTSTVFIIPRKATAQSDNKPHKVTVSVLPLEAEYTYIIIPKMSNYCYLRADILNTEKNFPLLAGEIFVFMDGNYVAKSGIGNIHPNEKLQVFLGVDPAVKFEYQPLKQLKDTKGYIQKTSTLKVRFNTVINNTKAKDIQVLLYDSLPKSNNGEIKVELINPVIREDDTNIVLTPSTNTVIWKLTVKAASKTDVPFMYNVEYPSNQEVENAF